MIGKTSAPVCRRFYHAEQKKMIFPITSERSNDQRLVECSVKITKVCGIEFLSGIENCVYRKNDDVPSRFFVDPTDSVIADSEIGKVTFLNK